MVLHPVAYYGDNAALLSAELIAALKKKYPDEVEYYDSSGFEEKPIPSLSEEDIGDWLAVVDYHC